MTDKKEKQRLKVVLRYFVYLGCNLDDCVYGRVYTCVLTKSEGGILS